MSTFYKDVGYLKALVANGQRASDYPMLLEQRRGLLRIWGIGEGPAMEDMLQGPGSPGSSNDMSNVQSPASGKEGPWGYPPLDYATPGATNGDTPRESTGSEGGLGPDNRPNFNSQVLLELFELYLVNMHNLHPFMNRSRLKQMFKTFIAQYSPDTKTDVATPPFVGLPHQINHGMKRKRSISGYGEPTTPRGPITRSLHNAIVLLVCALGKVFSYTSPRLPAPAKDNKSHASNAWGTSGESPHPTSSFSSESFDDTRPKNIEALPGMAYFAYATEILGYHQGGNTIPHAQAMILAALYLSQFARVLESWSWINNACRITMVLIKA